MNVSNEREQEQNLAYECMNGVYEWISVSFFFVAVAGMMKTTFKKHI